MQLLCLEGKRLDHYYDMEAVKQLYGPRHAAHLEAARSKPITQFCAEKDFLNETVCPCIAGLLYGYPVNNTVALIGE